MAVPPLVGKAAFRRYLRGVRRSYAAGRNFWDEIGKAAHCEPLRSMIDNATCIAGYCAHGGEPDILPIINAWRKTCSNFVIPRINILNVLQFCNYDYSQRIELYNNIKQPLADAPFHDPDLILTPLLGFDRALRRLGQGGGHYDQAFLAHPHALKIGIAWHIQEVDHIPVEAHDIPLDAILTDREWITR